MKPALLLFRCIWAIVLGHDVLRRGAGPRSSASCDRPTEIPPQPGSEPSRCVFQLLGAVVLTQTFFATSATPPCAYYVDPVARYKCQVAPPGFHNPVSETPRCSKRRKARKRCLESGEVSVSRDAG